MPDIKIVNYGSGNTGSLVAAFHRIGVNLTVIGKEDEILTSDLLVLPGVGSAKAALSSLQATQLTGLLHERNQLGKPILGICLGAQMLYEHLHEAGLPGLGWLPGEVRPFERLPEFNNGWCHIEWDSFTETGLTRGIKPSDTFYFNHQYYLPFNNEGKTAPVAELPDVPALSIKEHLCAIQFHPEKSQGPGALVLRNVIFDHYGL
jgi:glutamine amidotransferase